MFDYKMQRYKQDYVYTQSSTGELCNVEIICNIEEDSLKVNLVSDIEMSKEDIINVINGVQKDNFNRIKINIIKDCTVLYSYGGVVWKIIFDTTECQIADMEQL